MDYHLNEDLEHTRPLELSQREQEAIRSIMRPQLQEDMYLALAERNQLDDVPQREHLPSQTLPTKFFD